MGDTLPGARPTQVSGVTVQDQSNSQGSADVVLCSYNIHAGVGRDGVFAPKRILAVLQEVNADAFALQEVEHHDVDGTDLPAYLARELGCVAVLGPTLLRERRHYGNVLLSRLRVREVRRIELSRPGREPRGAIDALLDRNGSPLRVLTTHLGLAPGERRAQVRVLLDEIRSHDRGAVTVLTGDLNEWYLWGRPLRWLRRHFSRARAPATFPSGRPVFALDRVVTQPASALRQVRAHASPLARVASDHLPLVSTIRITH